MVKKKCTIGEVLKAARTKRNLKAEELAKLVNVSRARIYMWEQGDYVMEKNIGPLAQALHISEKRLREVNRPPGDC